MERRLKKFLFSKEFSFRAVVFSGPSLALKVAINVMFLPAFVIGDRLTLQPVVLEIHAGLDCTAWVILEDSAFEKIVLIPSLVLQAAVFEISEAGAVVLAVVIDPFCHQFAGIVI